MTALTVVEEISAEAAPAPEPEGWTVARVCEEAGITYRQLDYWLRCGYVRREGDRPAKPGSGHSRNLTDDEVRQLIVMGALVTAGIRADVAGVCARRLTDANEVALSPRVKLVLVD